MNESQKDTVRATAAAKAICDHRNPMLGDDGPAIMVTLEHAVAAVLLAIYRDPALAAGMLNEGLVPGIERRLAEYGAKRGIPKT